MSRSVHDMLLVGGNVVLDFVNTVDVRNDDFGPDYLNTYDDLIAFAERTSLTPGADLREVEAEAVKLPLEALDSLGRAKELREVFYKVCHAEFSQDLVAKSDLRALENAIRDAGSSRILTMGPAGLTYAWKSAHNLNLLTDALALAAHDLFINKAGRRPLRECPGRNCGWVFLDRSKGGKRRWCSDKTCGNQARISKFRAVAAN